MHSQGAHRRHTTYKRLPHHVAAADVAERAVAEADVEIARVFLVTGARLAEGDDRTQLPHQPGAPE